MGIKRTITALGFLFFSLIILSCQPEPQSDIHVNILYPVGGKGDRSFADSAYKGLVRASLEVDFTKTEAAPETLEEARNFFNGWISEPVKGKELIIIIGQTYSFMLEEAECGFNGRHVLFLDMNLPECNDLQSVNYETFAPSFLAGVAAMAVSSSKKAAVMEGMAIETVNQFTRGFIAGVEYAGGNVTEVVVLSDNETGFDNIDKAKREADRLFQNCDVIFPVAGASGAGVIEAAKDKGGYAIGVDTDQRDMGIMVVIGSVIKCLGQTVYDVICDLSKGVFEEGRIKTGLEERGTDFIINDFFRDKVLDPLNEAYEPALEAEKKDMEERDD